MEAQTELKRGSVVTGGPYHKVLIITGIAEVDGSRHFSFGASSLVPITHKAEFIYDDANGRGEMDTVSLVKPPYRLSDRFWGEPQVAALEQQYSLNKEEKDRIASEKRAEAKCRQEAGELLFSQLKPTAALAVIVARLVQDDCDLMTDYFATSTKKTIVIGWSNHVKDNFRELRREIAASGFPEAQHLVENDSKFEHREKYAGGAGYYLKDGSRYDSGWEVKKVRLYKGVGSSDIYESLAGDGGRWLQREVNPAPVATSPQSTSLSATMNLNTEKNGVEVSFNAKPDAAVLENLKANGWRWSRFNKVWYHRQTLENVVFAENLCGIAR